MFSRYDSKRRRRLSAVVEAEGAVHLDFCFDGALPKTTVLTKRELLWLASRALPLAFAAWWRADGGPGDRLRRRA